jgi:hypothetical protein
MRRQPYVAIVVLSVTGVLESLLNGLGYVRVICESSLLVMLRVSSLGLSVIEEVTSVYLVYYVNNGVSIVIYGLSMFVSYWDYSVKTSLGCVCRVVSEDTYTCCIYEL